MTHKREEHISSQRAEMEERKERFEAQDAAFTKRLRVAIKLGLERGVIYKPMPIAEQEQLFEWPLIKTTHSPGGLGD